MVSFGARSVLVGAAGGRGWKGGGGASKARLSSSSRLLAAFLNSRMDFPRLRAKSGIRLLPKSSNVTSMIIKTSVLPMSRIARLGNSMNMACG